MGFEIILKVLITMKFVLEIMYLSNLSEDLFLTIIFLIPSLFLFSIYMSFLDEFYWSINNEI